MEDIELQQQQPEKKPKENDLAYGIEDTPPWYLCLLLGFQVNNSC